MTLDELRELWLTSPDWQPVVDAVNALSPVEKTYVITEMRARGYHLFRDEAGEVLGWERDAPYRAEAPRAVRTVGTPRLPRASREVGGAEA